MSVREIILLMVRDHTRNTGKEPTHLYLSQLLVRELGKDLGFSVGIILPSSVFGLEMHTVIDREFYIKVH